MQLTAGSRGAKSLVSEPGSERGSLSGGGENEVAAADTSAPAPCDPPRGWKGQGRRIHLGGGSPRVRECFSLGESPLWKAPAIACGRTGRGLCPKRAQEPVATGSAADILLFAQLASGRAAALDAVLLTAGMGALQSRRDLLPEKQACFVDGVIYPIACPAAIPAPLSLP